MTISGVRVRAKLLEVKLRDCIISASGETPGHLGEKAAVN